MCNCNVCLESDKYQYFVKLFHPQNRDISRLDWAVGLILIVITPTYIYPLHLCIACVSHIHGQILSAPLAFSSWWLKTSSCVSCRVVHFHVQLKVYTEPVASDAKSIHTTHCIRLVFTLYNCDKNKLTHYFIP